VSEDPVLSIIIVNHRSEKYLSRCFASIRQSRYSLPWEIIVVDNPGPVGDVPVEFESRMHRLATSKRVGFGAACNFAAASARGDCLLFLNPDTYLSENAIQILYQFLQENPSAGIVGGRLVFPGGGFQASCRKFPSITNIWFSRQSLFTRYFASENTRYTLPDYDRPTKVDCMAGAMMMIRTELFRRLHGFDEQFFMYLEDIDLCHAAKRLGWDTVFVPEAEAEHAWGHSTGHYRFRRILWHHAAYWKYFRKHHSFLDAYVLLPLPLVGNCLLSLLIEFFTLRR
jgi:GT2 family glycosyltransferase